MSNDVKRQIVIQQDLSNHFEFQNANLISFHEEEIPSILKDESYEKYVESGLLPVDVIVDLIYI